MDIQNEVKAVEAEVVNMAEEVKEVVVSEADMIKSSVLSQVENFKAQLDQVKKDMAKLQQDFDQKKMLGVKLEGAIEGLQLTLNSLKK